MLYAEIFFALIRYFKWLLNTPSQWFSCMICTSRSALGIGTFTTTLFLYFILFNFCSTSQVPLCLSCFFVFSIFFFTWISLKTLWFIDPVTGIIGRFLIVAWITYYYVWQRFERYFSYHRAKWNDLIYIYT